MSSEPRGWKKIEELLLNEGFLERVAEIRKLDDFVRIPMTGKLMKDYNLPSNYHAFIREFIESGTTHKHLITPMTQVVSDHDETIEPADGIDPHEQWKMHQRLAAKGVHLSLSHDITQPELIKFIKEHWEDMIRPRLEALAGERRRLAHSYYPVKDREVYSAYKQRKTNGLTVGGILYKYGISKSQLYRIIKKQQDK